MEFVSEADTQAQYRHCETSDCPDAWNIPTYTTGLQLRRPQKAETHCSVFVQLDIFCFLQNLSQKSTMDVLFLLYFFYLAGLFCHLIT